MRRQSSLKVDRYVAGAVLPYILLALFLLTTILLAQQANRFAELLLVTRLPAGMTGQLLGSLLPTAVTFAMPTAVLAGILIGLSRMGGDSEVIALRAAGVGTWNIVRAPLVIGLAGSLAMLYVGTTAGPQAAENLRTVGLRIALYKLDSPVEPRAFNTDLPGRTIYVREGDRETGQWEKVFIYAQEKDGSSSLITARSGRIDSAAEQSELVLTDAVRTVLPAMKSGQPSSPPASIVTERLAQSRVRLPTARAAILRKLRQPDREAEEMNARELLAYAREATDVKQRREAEILLHRRWALGAAPLVFALLGAGLGLRIRRGGRAAGIVTSLVVLVGYYLLSLGGEQVVRAGVVPAALGLWTATAVTLGLALAVLRWYDGRGVFRWKKTRPAKVAQPQLTSPAMLPRTHARRRRSGVNLISLLDRGLFGALVFYFALSFAALVAIFLVFTTFEVSKFVAASGHGLTLIGRYLFYLLPLTAVSLVPTGALIAVLATYALLARRREALAWWSSGQSVYRLALPAVVFAGALCLGSWLVQEKVMPEANQKQDALRAQIRSGISKTSAPLGQQWLAAADGRRIYAFEYDESEEMLRQPLIFEFDDEGVHLRRLIGGAEARWAASAGEKLEVKPAYEVQWQTGRTAEGMSVDQQAQIVVEESEAPEVFKPTLNKPSQLSKAELSTYIKQLKARDALTADLSMALARKEVEPSYPLIMALLAVPFGIAFGRRSAVAALATALGIGLAFWGTASGLQQLGSYGLLPPQVAAWSPVVIFATLGVYFLSKTKT